MFRPPPETFSRSTESDSHNVWFPGQACGVFTQPTGFPISCVGVMCGAGTDRDRQRDRDREKEAHTNSGSNT